MHFHHQRLCSRLSCTTASVDKSIETLTTRASTSPSPSFLTHSAMESHRLAVNWNLHQDRNKPQQDTSATSDSMIPPSMKVAVSLHSARQPAAKKAEK